MNNRRKFLEQCAFSAFGVTVLSGCGEPKKNVDVADATSASAKTPATGKDGFGSAKRIIFINVKGGMSHIDTFDPKKGNGPGDTLSTKTDFQVTNYLEKTAKIADQISLIRSMTAKVGVHGPAQYFMRTAFTERNTIKHPNLGAWAQHFLGPSHDTLPSSACINQGPRYGNGFFAPAFSPIPILDPQTGLENIKSKSRPIELKRNLDLASQLSAGFLEKFQDSNVSAYRDFYDQTMRMLRSEDLDAFDLSKENKQTRERYGDSRFGQGCLLARRLVETGIRFVEVTSDGWDMHKDLKGEMEDICPPFDHAYAALIADLKERGLLDTTLVVLATEFGRKPKYEGDGRGHYPLCFTCGLAGAGVKRGFVYGASDAAGAQPDQPVTVGDFHATIGWAAGLPIEKEAVTSSGRPFRIGGSKAKPILEMFA